MAIISRICGVYFSHPCISLRVRPDPQAFASQSDLVLTAMKTMMNRKTSIKETESVSEREKLKDGLKRKQEVQVAETFSHGSSDTKAPQMLTHLQQPD